MDPVVRRFARISLACWLLAALTVALAWSGVTQG